MPSTRTRWVVALAALSALSAGLALRGCHPPYRQRPVEEILLDRKRLGLEALIAASKAGRILPFDQVLVVVQQELVQRLIEATLPFEQVIAARYRVHVESASVTFEDGFALVQLGGRASFESDPETFADIDVYGGLDIVELDPKTGILKGRVKILAVDTHRVDVKGFLAPVRRLVDDIGREQLTAFEPLLSKIEIPVRLEREIEIPAVNEPNVRIERFVLPVAAAVVDVKAFRGKLWVCASAVARPVVARAAASPARASR
jgi:hypothetical protein